MAGIKFGPASILRPWLPAVLEVLTLILLASAVGSTTWLQVEGMITWTTQAATADKGATMTYQPAVGYGGLWGACMVNVTLDGDSPASNVTGITQVCLYEDTDLYTATSTVPSSPAPKAVPTVTPDPVRDGARTLALVSLFSLVTSLVLRGLTAMGMCKSCPAALQPLAVATIANAVGAASIFGAYNLAQSSPLVLGWATYSLQPFSMATMAATNNPNVDIVSGAIVGPAANTAFAAGIAMSLNAIDGIWGLIADPNAASDDDVATDNPAARAKAEPAY